MKLMAWNQLFFAVIFVITCFISGCCGLTSFLFGCSNYTFHENSRTTHRLSWLESRKLCNLSGSDLVSIEDFKEWEFLAKAMQRFNSIKYFIGLRNDNRTGQWTWLSNGKPLTASIGEFPWAFDEPSYWGEIHNYCATIYSHYRYYFGRFDDLKCNRLSNHAGYICEKAVPCEDHKAPSHDPMSFDVRPLTATSVRSSWQLPLVNLLYRVNVRGFKLLYRLRNSSDQFATAIVWSNTYVSKDVSGLEKYTEYEFQVLAFTALGNGPVSSVRVVRTMEDVPSLAPVNLTVASQTSTSILASWLLPPADSRNGIIIGYKLFHKRKGSAESANTEPVQGGTTLRRTITGLLKYTEYEVQVLAFTAAGDGPKTPVKTVRTAREFCKDENGYTVPTCKNTSSAGHDNRFVMTVTAFSTVIVLLLIPIGLLLWQRRKMSRQNTNVSENWLTHSQSRAPMSSGEAEEQAYMELQPAGRITEHVYQTSQGKLENTEYYND